jgi:DNA-binding XRE family transcriptional regulator
MTATTPRRRTRGPYASLRAFFDHTGTRQADLAVDLGISETHMSNIVNGKRTPSYALAIAISRLTNVPVEFISSHAA